MIRELIVKYDTEAETLCINAEEMERLVRCKDCRFYDDVFRQCEIIHRHFAPMSYCSFGERKDEENEEENQRDR